MAFIPVQYLEYSIAFFFYMYYWLHSNPVARVRFSAGSKILSCILGLGVCPSCSTLRCLWL